eukprot:TRINITY_DN7435_c0_g2_i1.p1 TRINITY_DN7435_c0_g2~~TRINITY_DN7435_c0_g2_i1.p1  ORF type:complete len:170 (+),score=42.98 TRINITY_DN7435_c0_g2_i1:47-556(+)
MAQIVTVEQPHDWGYGLFGCFDDCGLCCDVFWCGVCMQSRLHDAMNLRPNSMNGPVCCGLFIGSFVIGGLACCLHNCYVRGATREKYNIEGNGCADCCTSLFCGACIQCQMHREYQRHGINPGTTCCSASKFTPAVGPVQQAYVGQPVAYGAPPQQYGTSGPVKQPCAM